MKVYLIILFLVCLLLTQYKREGFMSKDTAFKQAVIFLKKEYDIINDAEKKLKIINAMNYINFIKTLF